ncbi:MAG: hypothetical protein ACI9U2_001245 [Bradymonadia bacterium]|jgi:hypothetical protein
MTVDRFIRFLGGNAMTRGRLLFAGLMMGLVGCSADECPTGEPCDKACNTGEVALCVAEGICSCVPGSQLDGGAGAGGDGVGGGGGGEDCRLALPGELIIDEVMIDGVAPDDENEFIELVNATDEPLSVRGIKILGSKPDDLKERVLFTGGCLPAGTAVAMFKSAEDWIWSADPAAPPTFETRSYGFTNSAEFKFEVRTAGDVLLNTFAGGPDLDADGVSVTGNPPLSGQPANHMDVAGTPSSPGRCANGGTYVNACQDGGMGGAGGGEGGMGGGEPEDPRALVINEVDYDQPSTDTAEFIELYNADAESADLSNYTLVLTNNIDGAIINEIALRGQLAAGGYFVLGAAEVIAALPAGAISQALDSSIQNGPSDGVYLRHANGDTLDGVSWEGTSAGATEGTPSAIVDNNDTFSTGRCADGDDTDDNAADFAINAMPTPGGANDCPMGMGGEGGGMGGEGGGMGGEGGMGGMPPGDPVALVINEVEVEEPGSDTEEYIEIRNNGLQDAVLAEYTLEFVNGSNGQIYQTIGLDAAMPGPLAPGRLLVLAAPALLASLPDGVVSGVLPFSPQNGPDGLRIMHVSGTVTDSMSYEGPIDGWTEGTPAPDDAEDSGLSRCPDGNDTNDNGIDFRQSPNTIGAPNLCP